MNPNNTKENYRVCSRCVMDTSASDIEFDENGVCNYCTELLIKLEKNKKTIADEISHKDEFIESVKRQGKNKKYDCIIGVSGGVDSSYALLLAVKHGLRPLAVHLDNGWNSELAVHNISNLVNSLGVDLYTHVIDWEENRDMQRSLFKAHVVDIEMLMDNAMKALNFQQAAKYGLKYILAGTNNATEGMRFPPGWNHYKNDKRNIKDIHRKFGTKSIKTHLLGSTFSETYNRFVRGIQWISFLDYFPYNKQEALDILQKEVNYKPYPYKHYESVFTRFYQAYILPQKFGIDKRRLHLATLVTTGQMMREEALECFEHSPYPSEEQEKSDKEFVLKKLQFTEKEFEEYMAAPPIPHNHYKSEKEMMDRLVSFYRKLKGKK